MLLYAAMAAAAVALAVPAAASAADQWTDDHVPLEEGQTATQAFEGFLSFNAGVNGTFGCQETVLVEAAAGSHATVTKFDPTTSTCMGTGPAFTGCVLTDHTFNIVAAGWDLSFTTTPGKVTATSGDLTIHYEYEGCTSKLPTSHLEFGSVAVTPTLNRQDTITALTFEGFATSGVFLSGTFTPEGSPTLGLTTASIHRALLNARDPGNQRFPGGNESWTPKGCSRNPHYHVIS
jgi:hypothetical protein